MGSARHRSWSHTRGKLADKCQRALYFQYFPWGDESQNLARFLRRAASPESLAGTIVHRHLTIGLLQMVRRRGFTPNLHEAALIEYENALKESARIARAVRSGKRPPDVGTCLLHHLYGADDAAAEENGRATVERCLRAFESSPALAFLGSTSFDRWEPILTDTDDVPSFYASQELGFRSALGLRVYAAYDLALHWGDDLVLVDWKTGRRTARSEDTARRQLAIYGLWAMAVHKRPIERVRLVAYWIGEDEPWEPIALQREDIVPVIQTIETHDAIEAAALNPVANEKGEVVRYEANREAFPPSPEAKRCGWCAYRSICPEGRAAVSKVVDESDGAKQGVQGARVPR